MLILWFAILSVATAGQVRTPGGACTQGERGRGGWVDELGPPGTQFDLYLTDWRGQRLDPQPPDYPMRLTAGPDGRVSFFVPRGMAGVCDATNVTLAVAGGGGGSVGGGAVA